MVGITTVVLIVCLILSASVHEWAEADDARRAAWNLAIRPFLIGVVPTWLLVAGGLHVEPILSPILAALVGGGLMIIGLFFGIGAGSKNDDEHRRGSAIADTRAVAREMSKEGTRARLGDVPIPRRVEPYHFLLAGGTGSGKSQAFHQLMQPARETDAAIVVDIGGEFVKRYWQAGDIILNPLDQRGADWSPLAEIETEWEAAGLAKSLVPRDKHNDEWPGYLRALLGAVLAHVWRERGTNADVLFYMTQASLEDLAGAVAGTPAAAMLGEGAERMLGSIRAMAGSYLTPLSMLNPQAGCDSFSLKAAVRDERREWQFITIPERAFESLKPLVSTWLDIAITGVLSVEPDANRRTWFFMDEFASLPAIPGVESLLTKARKYGGVGVIGLQSIAQLADVYGTHKAQSLLSCCGTWLALRQGDPETAEYMSKFIGEHEVMRTNKSGGKSDGGSSENWSQQVTKERVVMASEMQNLHDRIGLLSVVGAVQPCWVEVPVAQLHKVAEGFVPKALAQRQQKPSPAPAEPAPEATGRGPEVEHEDLPGFEAQEPAEAAHQGTAEADRDEAGIVWGDDDFPPSKPAAPEVKVEAEARPEKSAPALDLGR